VKICKKVKIIVIGSGFSSLAAASHLAKEGHEVVVLEKNSTVGGRARQLVRDGFTFDIGPTFYWMPDIFEKFFGYFGKKTSDYYHLDKLNPAYRVYFGPNDSIDIADDLEKIKMTFEQYEPGSSKKLAQFIGQAKENYDIAINDLVYKPGDSLLELVTIDTIKKLGLFVQTIQHQVHQLFKNKKLQTILEFPVLFLGSKSANTPAFYNFMNYADFGLGTWHPKGGMYRVVQAMHQLAVDLGVTFHTDTEVLKFTIDQNSIKAVETNQGTFEGDVILSGADYHHTESLLDEPYRQYSPEYWDKRVLAPSALLFYVGFNKKLSNLCHHTLFFDTDFEVHSNTIYVDKTYPEEPLFYASFPSITDETTAPEGKEAGIFLIPLAPDLEDHADLRAKYFDIIIQRLEKLTGQSVKEDILFHESFGVKDFKEAYHSLKGNAYGLANVLLQTHILRPKLRSRKLNNLYFCGQLTVPGPGVPPSLISGKIVSDMICRQQVFIKK
jgi:phytoene desaturase